MSETPWAHLPNARLIDELIADFKACTKVWEAAEDDSWRFVRDGLWERGWSAAFDRLQAISVNVWPSVERATHHVAQELADEVGQHSSQLVLILQDFILALIVWPESSNLLLLTPDALRTIIDTCDGDVKHQAVLLLPAVIARHTT